MKLKGERVASDLIRELSNILLTEVKDEDLLMIYQVLKYILLL